MTEFVSLDGVIEDPGGSGNFKYGGWSFEIDRGDEGNKFKLDETLDPTRCCWVGDLRRVCRAWPTRTGEFADKFNDMPKYVVSSALEGPRMEQQDGVGR